MFGNFYFPDGTQPKWDSLCWLQKDFMMWFNEERLRCILTFPVESVTLLYKDGKFQDEDMYEFVCEEYARGHSFFTYISDTVDSLSSCCRLRSKIQTKEFNFTNGNIGIQTGSKSVITLNLNRIIQNWFRTLPNYTEYLSNEGRVNSFSIDLFVKYSPTLKSYLVSILDKVYKYQTAYNSLLEDMYNADLLPVYKAGFINLNRQYLTIGINGLNEAAEFLAVQCTDNKYYKTICRFIFSTIKEQNSQHKTQKLSFNTECVPSESLAIKNYNWDKQDNYWVPKERNLYASYIFIPSSDLSILEKIRLHGSEYIGDYLDGGSAAHLNLDTHLNTEQYRKILKYAAENGCSYLTFNVPNSECQDCGFITKVPIKKCPKCGSENIDLYDRVIGYLTKIKGWSKGRQIEQKTRVYSHKIKDED
jgi:ribonucleoside-triphosphate reductase